MFPSTTLCRAQEAYHRDRATGARLENVRTIAAHAAAAWEREARTAERREARHSRKRQLADLASAREQRVTEDRDRLFSENPDRGWEDS